MIVCSRYLAHIKCESEFGMAYTTHVPVWTNIRNIWLKHSSVVKSSEHFLCIAHGQTNFITYISIWIRATAIAFAIAVAIVRVITIAAANENNNSNRSNTTNTVYNHIRRMYNTQILNLTIDIIFGGIAKAKNKL